MTKKIIVVVASQRSGTTLFNKTLERYSDIKSYGEIFHDQAGIGENGRFFSHKLGLIKSDENLVLPTLNNQKFIWDSYINNIVEKSPQQTPLIDIKYNSWHHLDQAWKESGTKPTLLHFLQQDSRFKFVHIVRDNKFYQACSQVRALNTGNYHSISSNQSQDSSKIAINPKEILRFIKSYEENEIKFDSWLSSTSDRVEKIKYESFTGLNSFDAIKDNLSGIGIKLEHVQDLPLTKTSPNPQDWIFNYEEVCDLVMRNGYRVS